MARRRGAGSFLLDNLPYALTAALGAWVLLSVHWVASLVEVVASVLGPLWVILRVCPNCVLYGKHGCPSGFGLVSRRLVPRGDPEGFREAFSLHILSVAPMWFIPIGGVAYLLITGGPVPWVPLAAFVAVAFVLVPLKARYVTCARCAKRSDCPWGARTALTGAGRSKG